MAKESTEEIKYRTVEEWRGLEGKVVMVTGASSGLGREFCIDLAKAGCKIVAAARRIDRLKSLCEELNNNNRSPCGSSSISMDEVRAVAVELDVSAKGPEIEASVGRAWDIFGRIDALINNAGIRGGVHSPLNLSNEEWDDVLRTNLTGTWLASKYVSRFMVKANQTGSIINISSVGGVYRGQYFGGIAYYVSKAGINALTKVMALEFGAYNIRVNSISPGIFKSEITEGLMKKPWLKNVNKKIVPLGTLGAANPALTSLLRYLIHDSSQYVSGNMYIVDAGATLPGVPIFSSL